MDKYYFNYMCLKYFLKLSQKSKKMILSYFSSLHLIDWSFINNNRSFFQIEKNETLPIGCRYKEFHDKALEKYNYLCDNATYYITPREIYYPKRFKMFEPLSEMIFVRGDRGILNFSKNIAVVGTRKPSTYGVRIARDLGKYLSEIGANVISGMALGIDSIVHEAVLNSGGITTAVLASGVNQPYPSRHNRLYERIIYEGGAVISEMGFDEMPMRHQFLERNRLISGLADAVVVIEASGKSGSLTTARCGIEYNREVFAVPGNIYNKNAEGTNRLIYDGAIPLIDFYDIPNILGWDVNRNNNQNGKARDTYSENEGISEMAKKIKNELKKENCLKIQELIKLLNVEIGEINAGIQELILEGMCEYIGLEEIQIK